MIEEQLFKEELLDVYKNPKNKGEIIDPDLEAKLDNPICGDEVTIQLKTSRGDTVEKAVFSGQGCAISQASASLLVEYLEGKSLDQVKKVRSDDILKLIGINPNPARMVCALLSLNVLKEALISEL